MPSVRVDTAEYCPSAPLGRRHSFPQLSGILAAAELPSTPLELCQWQSCPLPGGQPTSNGQCEGTQFYPLHQFWATVKEHGIQKPPWDGEVMVTADQFQLVPLPNPASLPPSQVWFLINFLYADLCLRICFLGNPT